MAAIKKLLMFALLVLFCFTNYSSCLPLRDEDEIIHNVGLERNRRSTAQSLRIHFVYIDVNISNGEVIKELLNKAALYFKNTFKVKYPVKKILLQRRCTNDSYFLKNETGNGPGNVRYCKTSCDPVRPSCGLARVGDKDLDVCRVCDEHGHNCKVLGLHSAVGVGYTDTDFVLYVTSLSDKCDKPKTVAYAAACQQEMGFDRPIAGFLNICPSKIPKTDNHELLSTIKHEIFHALGFSPSLYAFYRNSTGSPTTERRANGLPAFDSKYKLYKWSDKVVKKITRSNWKIREDKGVNGEVKHDVHLIVTPRVRDEAQKHFNCSSLEGAELENQGGPGTELAHWEKRLFENEGMTGAFTQNSVFSRMTIALLEDTGWYEANYDMAEPLRWGKNLGCAFAKNSCKAWMIAQSKANNIQPFCKRLRKKNEGLHTGCSVDKSSVAMCNLVQYNQSLPLEYQYFTSLPDIPDAESYGGSVDYADFCPYFQAFTWTKGKVGVRGSSCTAASNQKPKDKNYALEDYGNAKCFMQEQKWQKTKCQIRWITSDWGSGCYGYQCSDNGLKVLVNGNKFKCYHEGQVIHLEIQSNDKWVHKGSIICPSCQDVCYNAKITCPGEVRPAPHQPDMPKINPIACQANTLVQTNFYVLIGVSIMLQILYR